MGVYGDNEKLANEKVEQTIDVGSYLGVVGKTRRVEGPKRATYLTDIFLVAKTQPDGTITTKMMAITKGEKGLDLAFTKDPNGALRIYGHVFAHRNPVPKLEDTPFVRDMWAREKGKFARVFGAFDDATGTVSWEKIQQSVGTMVSFNIVERNNFFNLEVSSLKPFDKMTTKITEDSIVECYRQVEEDLVRREAMKQTSGPQESAPPPDEPPF